MSESTRKKRELYPHWCLQLLYILSILGLVLSFIIYPLVGCGLGGCTISLFLLMLGMIVYIFVLPMLIIKLQKKYSMQWGYLLLITIATDILYLYHNANGAYIQFRYYLAEFLFSIFGVGLVLFLIL